MPLAPPRSGESLEFHVYPLASNEGTLGEPERIIWASIQHLCSRNVAHELAWNRGIKGKRDRENVAWNLKLYVRKPLNFAKQLELQNRTRRPSSTIIHFST